MTRPDLDAIRARNLVDWTGNGKEELSGDVAALLAYIDELERCTAHTTSWTIGETEWAQRIATLEHMLSEERENVDTLRARVAELEAEIAALEPRSVMLKRVDAALTEAGCVQPLAFDGTIESAIKDLARRATRAEQLFVDEYDARKAAEREIAELKARDDETFDGTDAAHPAWWRGNDAGVRGAVNAMHRMLADAISDSGAFGSEELNDLHARIKSMLAEIAELKSRIVTLEAMKP